MNTVTLNLAPISELADDQFYDLCLGNPDVKFERNSKGEVIILVPTGGEMGIYNARLVEIYRQNQIVEVLNNPDELFGENVLTEFSLDLRSL